VRLVAASTLRLGLLAAPPPLLLAEPQPLSFLLPRHTHCPTVSFERSYTRCGACFDLIGAYFATLLIFISFVLDNSFFLSPHTLPPPSIASVNSTTLIHRTCPDATLLSLPTLITSFPYSHQFQRVRLARKLHLVRRNPFPKAPCTGVGCWLYRRQTHTPITICIPPWPFYGHRRRVCSVAMQLRGSILVVSAPTRRFAGLKVLLRPVARSQHSSIFFLPSSFFPALSHSLTPHLVLPHHQN
jgi:hypothetical protein